MAAARPARRSTCRCRSRRRPGRAGPQVVAASRARTSSTRSRAAEEVGGVGLVERPQALVRVRRASVGAGGPAPASAATSIGTNSAIGGRPAVAMPRARTSATAATRRPRQAPLRPARRSRARRRWPSGSGPPARARSRRRQGSPAVVEQHALRHDPAVHDPGVGRGGERAADATDQRRQRAVRQRAATQAVGQRPAVHPAHDDVRRPRLAPVVMDRDDRRVAQRRHPMGGGLERAHELRAVGDLLADDADRRSRARPQAGGRRTPCRRGRCPSRSPSR